ncbi:hypothetical protein OGAPHI_002707 [Ogataea philodendri]|uniref:SEC7 domain-containing protein n=1 Tax=Ogataea philodendri TaxID=1378263 RepID=A0A9P8PCV4_9ASCO|nr:uncharacterized protein OGAPHI_002707 [Ogataea philodendri]KAH3668952.1 hypothetical protein OGAPHI_002707 [Ogataea philodendri]
MLVQKRELLPPITIDRPKQFEQESVHNCSPTTLVPSEDENGSPNVAHQSDQSSFLSNITRNRGLLETVPDSKTAELHAAAHQIYDSTFGQISKEDYLAFLGGGIHLDEYTSTEIDTIRRKYMELFKWNPDLLRSLRSLCRKLFFKGESQFIDTVLDSFADSWFQSPQSATTRHLYGNSNGVYLVAYSFILLNTDLHSEEIAKNNKITRSTFVKNTIVALQQNIVPVSDYSLLSSELKRFYAGILERKLSLSTATPNPRLSYQHSRTVSRSKAITDDNISIFTEGRDTSFSSTTSGSSFGFAKAILMERNMLRAMHTNRSDLSFSSTSVKMADKFELNDDGKDFDIGPNNDFIIEEEGDLQLELDGPPWIKEGLQNVVLSKHILQSFENKTGKKNLKPKWQSLFVVVFQGELKFFSFDANASTVKHHGDGHWWEYAKCVTTINLCSCFAQIVERRSKLCRSVVREFGESSTRTGLETYWTLNIPSPEISKGHNYYNVHFCAGTPETAQEFVETCNFWAARSSAIPLSETMSSLDYGWSDKSLNCFRNLKSIEIENYLTTTKFAGWIPLMNGLVPTHLNMAEQLFNLKKHYRLLHQSVKDHKALDSDFARLNTIYDRSVNETGLLSKMLNRSNVQNKEKVVKNIQTIRVNYVNKLNYLDNELLRFKRYSQILEKAIRLRNEKLKGQMA